MAVGIQVSGTYMNYGLGTDDAGSGKDNDMYQGMLLPSLLHPKHC
jgi:hypothetical protein